MKLTFANFKGIAPKFDPEQLMDDYAVTSKNTRLGRMMLEPWRAPLPLVGAEMPHNEARSVLRYDHKNNPSKWFAWKREVSAVAAPLILDAHSHVIFCHKDIDPQITASDVHGLGTADSGAPASFDLGIPRPKRIVILDSEVTNPDWEEDNEITPDEYDRTYVSYACAYVDGWGRIGPMSDPSESVEHIEYNFQAVHGKKLRIDTTLPPIATGRSLAKLRIYRSNFSAGSTGDYQFLKEVTIAMGNGESLNSFELTDFTYAGDLLDAPINEDWVGPPNTDRGLYPNGSMEKVVVVNGEFMCGHNEKIICFSEPNAPHAWPTEYYHVFQEKVVTISTAGSNIVVLTDGFPYVLSGVHPSSMSPTRLADQVPCVSKRGVAEINDAVFYVAENSLYMISNFAVTNVLEQFVTDHEWRKLVPSEIMLAVYDDRLFISSPAEELTYVFDPRNPDAALRTVEFNPQAMIQLPETNDLAYIEKGDDKVVVFDGDDSQYMPIQWESKIYQYLDPVGFSCARVRSSSYPVDVTFTVAHGEHEHSFTKTVESSDWFWIDLPYRGTKWQAAVSHDGGASRPEIFQIQLASAPTELD